MRVYGFNEEKELVKVDIPARKIVKHGIDPWRLDFFATDPVEFTVDGQRLSFLRHRDAVFAYQRPGRKLVIARRDEGGDICLTGEAVGSDYPAIEGIQLNHELYATHLVRYLTAIELYEKERRDLPLKTWTARSSYALEVKGGVVTYNPYDDKEFWRNPILCTAFGPSFVGSMLNKVETQAELPDSVTRVMQVFQEFKPVVVGEALRCSLMGQPPSVVQFFVAEGSLDQVRQRARLLQAENINARYAGSSVSSLLLGCGGRHFGLWLLSFSIEGIEYVASERTSGESLADLFLHDFNVYTSQCLYATSPRAVSGLSIAFHDIAKSQSRPLWNSLHAIGGDLTARSARKRDLERCGVKALPWRW